MAKKRRLRFRFTLATLLVVMGLLCVFLAYYRYRARQADALVVLVQDQDMDVVYEFDYWDDTPGKRKDAEPGVPTIFLDWLGKDFFYDVSRVDVYVTAENGPDLSRLCDLHGLKYLKLGGELSDCDVELIAEMESLQRLEFFSASFVGVRGISALKKLSNVREIMFSFCRGLTNENLASLQELPIESIVLWGSGFDSPGELGTALEGFSRLNSLTIFAQQLSSADLAALAGMSNLRELSLVQWHGREVLTAAEKQLLLNLPGLIEVEVRHQDCDEEFLRQLNRVESLQTIHYTVQSVNSKDVVEKVSAVLPDKTVSFTFAIPPLQ